MIVTIPAITEMETLLQISCRIVAVTEINFSDRGDRIDYEEATLQLSDCSDK